MSDLTSESNALDPIVKEAHDRFQRCMEWESDWRAQFLHDVKFANGDSKNGWQWPDNIRNSRQNINRPCLTMNLIKAHNRMISNDARKNKSEVKFFGMGNGSTSEMAGVYQDLYRWVSMQSQAQAALTQAREFQIDGGIGYVRLITEYDSDDSFDVSPRIMPVDDPLAIVMDRDSQRLDRLDSRYAMVFDDVADDEFKDAYPDIAPLVGKAPLGIGSAYSSFYMKNRTKLMEYFRRVPERKRLLSFVHLGERHTIAHDRLEMLVRDREALDRIVSDPTTRDREVMVDRVEWYLIAGQRIIDQTIWPGRYIPIIPIIGEETKIEGRVDRKGHTRSMLDAQRMFNYNASAQVEYGALATKAQWIAPAKSIEEFEQVWRTINTENPAVVPYQHYDEDHPDATMPPPQRIDPPKVSEAFQVGMENAKNQFMMVTGQYENSMGEQGNERTGAAINARRRQGATATYHFQDNYEVGLIALGKQFLDLCPKVFDTKRTIRISVDEGMDFDLELDPGLAQGYIEHRAHDGAIVKKALNPLVGKFDVAPKVGPAFDSKQEETADSLTLLMTQAPAFAPLIADLMVKNMQFDGAQEAAARLRRMVPKQALGEGPSPAEAQLQQQVQVLQVELAKLLTKNSSDKLKLIGKEQKRDIEAYNAETQRMKALQEALPLDEAGLRQVVEQLVSDSLQTNVAQIDAENEPQEEAEAGPEAEAEVAPFHGAQQAPDGRHYLPHPEKPGQWLHVQERPPFEGARRAPDGEFYVPDGKGGWLHAKKGGMSGSASG